MLRRLRPIRALRKLRAMRASAVWSLRQVPGPVLAPATSTSALAVRIVERWIETGALPDGAFSLLVGSAGDLLDHLGPQDNVAFTGGSETITVSVPIARRSCSRASAGVLNSNPPYSRTTSKEPAPSTARLPL